MFKRPVKDTALAGKLAALQALRANVMIADPKLNILHMNGSMLAFMQEAEADLGKVLPGFSGAGLIGRNIDVFQKASAHGCPLEPRDAPQNACLEIGRRIFDVQLTPLHDQGAMAGFVLEWQDAKHRLQGQDNAARMSAISRYQTIIEFTTDGVIIGANENFLNAMGYTLEQIAGRHHSIFVEPGFEKTAAYAEMWADLRRGKFKAGQFKRFTKAGKTIWIEGAYNPILDENGHVCKIVKFASDVSSQVALLSDLAILVDEMTEAVEQSTSQAQHATEAAVITAQSVQSVAVSSQQLAASITEIAQSMVQSRVATETAFEEAVNVGGSTDALARAAQEMNGIVGLIRTIAGQINLLALNATIEAARAGDAGRGFAVVASEVKSLAIAAAQATEQITREIDSIQGTSATVANAVVAIRKSMTTVRENVSVTAAAVEEQSVVTRGMSEIMQNASNAVETVSSNVQGIGVEIQKVSRAITRTQAAAKVLAR